MRISDWSSDVCSSDLAFFCNSGAEAVEGALKLARRYHYAQGHPERMRVISCQGAFHGRTLTTLSAAGNKKYLEGAGPVAEGFDLVPFGNMNELRNAIRTETGRSEEHTSELQTLMRISYAG